MNKQSLEIIKQNIDLARSRKAGRRIIAVVSGSVTDRDNWDSRFRETGEFLFGSEARILSLVEEIDGKTREGNFLGTLLAFRRIREYCRKQHWSYEDSVTLLGMIFGRGERMSPFTQIEGNRKPAIMVNCGYTDSGRRIPLMAIEESLLYFTPVARYLEQGGFRGILDKWGDETEIPSLALSAGPPDAQLFCQADIIKFVSVMKIKGELALQKDWVVFDDEFRMLTQLCRDSRENLEAQLEGLGVHSGADGFFSAGVSLGPVALSYAVLKIAAEIFGEEILRPDVYFDFDPYFMMALSLPPDTSIWEKKVASDPGLQELVAMIPAFFTKIQALKQAFERQYGRPLSVQVFDLGSELYWADIGQHEAMAGKYMSLLEDSPAGEIARYLEGVSSGRDEQGNIIIDSEIAPGIEVYESVILGSRLSGSGVVQGSVIKDSVLHNPALEGAFSVLSRRSSARLVLPQGSGIYKSLGNSELVLEAGRRSGTLLLDTGPLDLQVAEGINLRKRTENYERPILDNALSFREAFESIDGTSMEELSRRRNQLLESLTD